MPQSQDEFALARLARLALLVVGSSLSCPGVGATLLDFEIVASYPHDVTSYTQGLVYASDHLYESSGQYGRSRVQRSELVTGTVSALQRLKKAFFGEGLARHGDRLYQLTWKSERGFIYRMGTLERIGDFRFEGQGWGLASDGQRLYMSNGSAVISVRNTTDFSEIREFEVRDGGRALQNLNELEFIEGQLWANVYTSPIIVVIDPHSGSVSARLDLSQLVALQGPEADVLNGIAYDPASRRLFVTGKLWPTVYELRVKNKPPPSGTAFPSPNDY
jgi:glutamine cyclotransferase